MPVTYKARHQVIRELRERKHITQEVLADRAGPAWRTIQQMESQREFEKGREFQRENLKAVAGVLGVLLPDVAHDVPPTRLVAWLYPTLNDLKLKCKERDHYLHTPHLLFALLQPRWSALRKAILDICDVELIEARLEAILEKIANELTSFKDFDWEKDNRYVRRGLQYASTKDREANDSDISLAILTIGSTHPGSEVVHRLRKWLQPEGFLRVVAFLQNYPPPPPPEDHRTPRIPPTAG